MLARRMALLPRLRVKQGNAHLTIGVARQRLRPGIQPSLRIRFQQRGFQQRPQRLQADIGVLHRDHRGEVMQAQIARVFDARAQPVLQRQRGIGHRHAAVQQQCFELRAHCVRSCALQHEWQYTQASAAQVGIAAQRLRHIAPHIRTEPDHARAAVLPKRGLPGRLLQQFQRAPMQRPAWAQRFGGIEMRAQQGQVQPAHAVHQGGKVAAEQCGHLARGLRTKRGGFGRLAGAEFKRDHAAEHRWLAVIRHVVESLLQAAALH